MTLSIRIIGAAGNVTGSCNLVEYDDLKILVDCGSWQERAHLNRNWEPFPFKPSEIDLICLTHAHLDHCGLLPRLCREGFSGKILLTSATADLASIILKDSAKLQKEDIVFKAERHRTEGRQNPRPLVPLFDEQDVKRTLELFEPVYYNKPWKLSDKVSFTFTDSGHILGSCSILLTAGNEETGKSILFSGDVGRPSMPILRDPSQFNKADAVIMESTYGDREHSPTQDLGEIILDAVRRGGNIVIPAFAVERTQDLLFHLNMLIIQKKIPGLMIFVDSPMASEATRVFKRHPELYDEETTRLVSEGKSPFDSPHVRYCSTQAESRSLNRIKGSVIIISGSGMCTGGRIKHHLVHNISRTESTIVFTGYQAGGTLGREIVEGTGQVRIHGEQRPVRAKIVQLGGMSGHADRSGLTGWLGMLETPPKLLVLNHGEQNCSRSLADHISAKIGIMAVTPSPGDQFTI